MRFSKVNHPDGGTTRAHSFQGVKMSVGEDCNSNRNHDVNVTSFGSTAADEYQWFLDYGSQSQHQPASVLSSLAACEELSYYNDLALAEVDMEDFRTEDIHSVLSTLPAMCCPQIQAEHEGEMYASVSGSLMDRYDLDVSMSPHSSSHGYDESAGSTMSICKSELLFSPVRECPLPAAGNFSVDSLDCDELLLTCQANKDNYTIAFEASDESEYRDNGGDSEATSCRSENWPTRSRALDTSMARSESIYTTWSKLRKRSSALHLRCHASGNNNTSTPLCMEGVPSALKSQSLPNLSRRQLTAMTTSETRCVKIYDTQSILSDTNSSISCGSKKNNLSLIKLFMKQKSCSNEGMSVSSVSECWLPSNNSQTDSDSYAPDSLIRLRTLTDKLGDTTNGNAWLATDEPIESCGFEDSLVAERTHGLIEEEDERSESVEQLSESVSRIEESILDLDLSSSHSKPKCSIKFNVNNNNSIERVVVSPQRFRRGQGTQTKRLSFASSGTPTSSSYSSGEETEVSRINPVSTATSMHNRSTQIPLHLIDRSIQTSGYNDVNSLKSSPFQLLESPNGTSLVKVIVPTANQEKKPVYVFYPNYTLPDLAFLRENQKDFNVEKVYLLPQKLDTGSPQDKTPPAKSPPTKPQRRPFSCNDVEALRKKGFAHIQDWDSLTFLLPREYRQILADVPEIMSHLTVNEDELKPLFCVSPQTRSAKTRPWSLDCGLLSSQDGRHEEDTLWPLLSEQNGAKKTRPLSCDCTPTIPGSTQMSSTSSSATQPSSGYRGSPTMLSDSSQNQNAYNPLFVYHYDSASSESSMFNNTHGGDKKTQGPPLPKRSISAPFGTLPPRPPLPRGILRNIPRHYNCKSHKNDANKRYSMFELGGNDAISNKQRSLSVDLNEKDIDEMEDEGVDAGTGTDSSLEEALIPPMSNMPIELDELLHLSGLSSLKDSVENFNDGDMIKLRQQVSKFLSTQEERCCTPNNTPECGRKKTVSFAQLRETAALYQENADHLLSPTQPVDMTQKKMLVTAVGHAVERLIHHFTTAVNSEHCSVLGDSRHTPAIGHLVLNTLCPALYAALSDGLRPVLRTAFGDAANSVWQVVEATAQQGPLAKSLNDLVLTINNEHVLTEGMIKFNAFVFGLLNVGSVDAWLGFLRTRDSVLRKHYASDGLFVMANTSGAAARACTDELVNSLKLLHLLPFNLDLLFECKLLRESLSRMETRNASPTNKSWNFMKLVRSLQTSNSNLNQSKEDEYPEKSPEAFLKEVKPRPRSCVETWTSVAGLGSFPDIASTIQKRWSNININSKLFQAFDRLACEDNAEEDYSDSLETKGRSRATGSPDNTSDDNTETIIKEDVNPKREGGKFRRLQMKWEMMSGKEVPDVAANGEKMSLGLMSPMQNTNTIRSRIPRLVTSPVRPTPPPSKKLPVPPSRTAPRTAKVPPAKRAVIPRVSRLDQPEVTVKTVKTLAVRPTSLPYKGAPVDNNRATDVPLRRAVSSTRTTPRFVRTLCHHLASDNGHLTFKEGDRLRVVLEVDSRWLLCCRGENKGLVPRTSVIRDS